MDAAGSGTNRSRTRRPPGSAGGVRREWINNGELRAIDIGRGRRIADADPERFLKARETAPRKQDDTNSRMAEPRS